MEYWDIYDANRKLTGRTMVRGPVKKGDYHLVVCICVFNSEGKMLIQQRQTNKIGWPNMWDISAAGSALKGETSGEAAGRELFEELGIDYSFEGVRPQLSVNFDRGFDDIYLIEKDVELSELRLQPEEVQNAKWATEEEILQMIQEGIFIPYHSGLIQTYFSMRKNYGTTVK